ncbi:MAG: Nudix-like protein NDP and NTP phosphohydrolase YmfB [candidate division WS6 bacterium GW2011_GWF2_39_15]|uniref:Nudix-like protein NDP and NTP phosphohydrolase YmfB n=1 Tax=candidate division WS6 bacterium GW2011_GWF2_39_15 TaxID=1619100 RepID=A0A0G0Q510_9BACT|nr:MAG: Nudix-like protein NDP and NTP phosphohydrolase YmfB [candidate division WS6 bacterium GW2011_GWF2_39_15]
MRYITAQQYKKLTEIPRGRMTSRFLVFSGVILEKEGNVLLCRTHKSKYPGAGIPGGKVLWSEKIKETVIREALEETGYRIELNGILGLFQREPGPEDEEFLRVIFTGDIKPGRRKTHTDPEIKDAVWVPLSEILKGNVQLQSKQLLIEFERYNKGTRYPLDLLDTYIW